MLLKLRLYLNRPSVSNQSAELQNRRTLSVLGHGAEKISDGAAQYP
jgi:hypothetical protein